MPRQYRLVLKKSERQELLGIARTGHRSARSVLRAQILLKSAEGWTETQLAEALAVSERTVRRVRKRADTLGVLAAIEERPRPGAPRKLTPEEEARVVALACSAPPQGRSRWTVRLLAHEAIERELIKPVAVETVRQVLEKTKSSRGRFTAGVRLKSPLTFSKR